LDEVQEKLILKLVNRSSPLKMRKRDPVMFPEFQPETNLTSTGLMDSVLLALKAWRIPRWGMVHQRKTSDKVKRLEYQDESTPINLGLGEDLEKLIPKPGNPLNLSRMRKREQVKFRVLQLAVSQIDYGQVNRHLAVQLNNQADKRSILKVPRLMDPPMAQHTEVRHLVKLQECQVMNRATRAGSDEEVATSTNWPNHTGGPLKPVVQANSGNLEINQAQSMEIRKVVENAVRAVIKVQVQRSRLPKRQLNM